MTDTAVQQDSLDIGREQIGSVYGKALLAATRLASNTVDVLAEFESLVEDVLQAQPEFDVVLSSPRVSVGDKIRILDNVFSSRMSDHLLTFLKVVCRHERLDCLREICKAARRQDNEQHELVEVTISSAEPLEGRLAQQVEQRIRQTLGSEIAVDYRINPDLLGGIVVRAGDKVFDGSVANRLQQLRSETLRKSFEAAIGALDQFTASEPSEE